MSPSLTIALPSFNSANHSPSYEYKSPDNLDFEIDDKTKHYLKEYAPLLKNLS